MALLIFVFLTSIVTFVGKIIISRKISRWVLFHAFPKLLFLSHPLLLDFLYFLSSDKSDSLDDESAMMGLTPGPLIRALFPFVFDDFFGCVIGVGSSIFFSIGFDSNCDVVKFVAFVPIVVESKGGQLIKIFWRSNSRLSLQISKTVL